MEEKVIHSFDYFFPGISLSFITSLPVPPRNQNTPPTPISSCEYPKHCNHELFCVVFSTIIARITSIKPASIKLILIATNLEEVITEYTAQRGSSRVRAWFLGIFAWQACNCRDNVAGRVIISVYRSMMFDDGVILAWLNSIKILFFIPLIPFAFLGCSVSCYTRVGVIDDGCYLISIKIYAFPTPS